MLADEERFLSGGNTMDMILETLSALRSESRVMLATIVATSGSTPASAFARMLLKDRCTASLGTVGGGCVEGDVLREARTLYESGRAAIMTFHLTEDHFESGMLCGGSFDVLIEPLSAEHIPLLENLSRLQEEGEDCVVATALGGDGSIRGKAVFNRRGDGVKLISVGSYFSEGGGIGALPDFRDRVSKVLQRMETSRLPVEGGEVVLEPVGGHPGLFIFGGGHVSRFVSRAAAMAGFRVTVVDDRPEFANSRRFPEAARTLAVEFSRAFNEVAVGRSGFIVIVTRGHRSDEEVLEQAVKTPAQYIGMIGSRTKVQQAFRNLEGRGTDPETLRRVHAPIGIDIGATTAEEIGISIVAELIHARRAGGRPIRPKSDAMREIRE